MAEAGDTEQRDPFCQHFKGQTGIERISCGGIPAGLSGRLGLILGWSRSTRSVSRFRVSGKMYILHAARHLYQESCAVNAVIRNRWLLKRLQAENGLMQQVSCYRPLVP